MQEYCDCEREEPYFPDSREIAREERRRIKEERMRKKLRKQRKRAQMEKECSSERMNCFQHDNEHWRTAPLWTSGPFCFCMNANNNTYSCVRTINSTHNFLYCEFTTGLVTFYNLRIGKKIVFVKAQFWVLFFSCFFFVDPFELQNRVDQLKAEERSYLHNQLKALIACKGRSCTIAHNSHIHGMQKSKANVLPVFPQTQRFRKRKQMDVFGNGKFLEKKK